MKQKKKKKKIVINIEIPKKIHLKNIKKNSSTKILQRTYQEVAFRCIRKKNGKKKIRTYVQKFTCFIFTNGR